MKSQLWSATSDSDTVRDLTTPGLWTGQTEQCRVLGSKDDQSPKFISKFCIFTYEVTQHIQASKYLGVTRGVDDTRNIP